MLLCFFKEKELLICSIIWLTNEEAVLLFAQIQAKTGDKISKGSLVSSQMDSIKLKTFVALTMDIASASPRRYFFEARANILNVLFHELLLFFIVYLICASDMLCQAANVHITTMFCDRSWAFLQQLNMKKRGFSISLLLREEMTCTGTIRRRAGLFLKWACLHWRILFSLKEVSCSTCLNMQNYFCNNMSLLSLRCLSWFRSDIWFRGVFRCWRNFLRYKCLLNGWYN